MDTNTAIHLIHVSPGIKNNTRAPCKIVMWEMVKILVIHASETDLGSWYGFFDTVQDNFLLWGNIFNFMVSTTLFWFLKRMLNLSKEGEKEAVRLFTDRWTEGQTDGTENITSTTDVGGNNAFLGLPFD